MDTQEPQHTPGPKVHSNLAQDFKYLIHDLPVYMSWNGKEQEKNKEKVVTDPN